MFGVSPAYFFSRFTTDFNVEQIAIALPDLRRMGFKGFQLEVFHLHRLSEWEQGSKDLCRVADSEGMVPTQFVAHFMLKGFESGEAVESAFGLEEMKRVVEIVSAFPSCKVVTLPIPPFKGGGTLSQSTAYSRWRGPLVRKIGMMRETVESAGLKLALEIMPGSLLGDTDGFLRLCEDLGTQTLGYNFDTGHAFHSGESLVDIPARVSRIYGTHLKDTDGRVGSAIRPGLGMIRWGEVLGTLLAAGYKGSLDLEIACESPRVEEEYAQGLRFLRDMVEKLRP